MKKSNLEYELSIEENMSPWIITIKSILSVIIVFLFLMILLSLIPKKIEKETLETKWSGRFLPWYQRQVAQDCVKGPFDQDAIDAVLSAFHGESKYFYGNTSDSFNYPASEIEHLKTRPNIKGEGVIVTSWRDIHDFSYSRIRSAWLVLWVNKHLMVYPINTIAASDLGFLHGIMPESIQRRSGLVDSYKTGETMMDQLGFDETSYGNRHEDTNDFPQC